MDNNKFIDTCRLLGNYDGRNVYVYNCSKYDAPRSFYTPNYYYLPNWADAMLIIWTRSNFKLME